MYFFLIEIQVITASLSNGRFMCFCWYVMMFKMQLMGNYGTGAMIHGNLGFDRQ